jgi:hypothetical protein
MSIQNSYTMNTKKIITLIALCFCTSWASAQVEGVSIAPSTQPPADCAMLDVVSDSKGVILPRCSIADANYAVIAIGVADAIEGIIVYNTNPDMIDGRGKGYYYWDGYMWMKFGSGASIPQVSYGDMRSMQGDMTADDQGTMVFVTTLSASCAAEPVAVSVIGLWYLLPNSCTAVEDYYFRKIQHTTATCFIQECDNNQ